MKPGDLDNWVVDNIFQTSGFYMTGQPAFSDCRIFFDLGVLTLT